MRSGHAARVAAVTTNFRQHLADPGNNKTVDADVVPAPNTLALLAAAALVRIRGSGHLARAFIGAAAVACFYLFFLYST